MFQRWGLDDSYAKHLQEARGRHRSEEDAKIEACVESGGDFVKVMAHVAKARGIPIPDWLLKDAETSINSFGEGAAKTQENVLKNKPGRHRFRR